MFYSWFLQFYHRCCRHQDALAHYFFDHEAIDEASAISRDEVLSSEAFDKRSLKIFLRRGIVAECARGYYLRPIAWAKFQKNWKRIFFFW